MDYSYYSTDDFLLDEAFQQWVLHPDKENQAYWQAVIRQYPEKATHMQEARERLLLIQFRTYQAEQTSQDRILQNIRQHTEEERERIILPAARSYSLRKSSYAVAATVSLLLLSLGGWFLLSQQQTYQTGYGENLSISLSDGTLISLNANSVLETSWFGWGDFREVNLQGEAFFEVAEDPAKPFIVYTPDLKVRVTGTSFNVKSRSQNTKVVLATGSVEIASPQQEKIFMKAGDMVEYDQKKEKISRAKVDPELYSAWRKQMYYFKNASFNEIAGFVHENYGYQLILEESLDTISFTAQVNLQNIDDLLILLSETLEVEIQKLEVDKKIKMSATQ